MINLDLSRIVKGAKAPSQAQLLGVVIQKTDYSEEAEAALKGAGVEIGFKVEGDETVVYKQADIDLENEEGLTPVKLDSDFVVVCKGLKPETILGDGKLKSILKTQGFMPGISMASEALYSTIRSAITDSESAKDAVAKIEAATEAFKEYASNLVNAIPVEAFNAMDAFQVSKYEKAQAVAKAEQEKAEKEAKEKEEQEATAKVEKEVVEASSKAKKSEDSDEDEAMTKPDSVSQEEWDKMDMSQKRAACAKKEEKAPAIDTKAIADMVAAVVKNATEALGKQIGVVTASVQTMQKGIGDLNGKVESAAADAAEAKKLAQKSEAAVRGTVLGGEPGVDDDPTPTKKDDAGGGMGVFDTAYQRSVRKAERPRFHSRNGSRGLL